MSELQTRANQAASLWRQNPALTHLLGLSPLLALSNSLSVGLAFGLLAAVIFLTSAVAVKVLGHWLRGSWRFVGYMLIVAGNTTLAGTACSLLAPDFISLFGIYLPLLCCNFALLARLDACRDDPASRVTVATLRLSAGYLLALIIFSGLRELLATGSLLAGPEFMLIRNSTPTRSGFIEQAPAAFVLLGLLLAAKQWLDSRLQRAQKPHPGSLQKVPRERVTGKLKGK